MQLEPRLPKIAHARKQCVNSPDILQFGFEAFKFMSEQILNDLIAKYQTCQTYKDTGTLCIYENGKALPGVSFATHFHRPNGLRFEWSGQAKIKRHGFSRNSKLSTIICQSQPGFPSYFDPRNTFDPTPDFSTLRLVLQFDRAYSGWIQDVVISLLSDDYDTKHRVLNSESLPEFRLLPCDDSESLKYKRESNTQEREYLMTVTEVLELSPALYISRYTYTRLIKKEDKKPLPALDRPSCREAQKRWLSQDHLAINDYRFADVNFDSDIPSSLFEETTSHKHKEIKILQFPR